MVSPDFQRPLASYAFSKGTNTMDQSKTPGIQSKSDVELMALLAERDTDAMQEIYKRYEPTLRTVIQSVLHEGGETDDALNDVFLQLWDRADRFVAEKGLHGFLVTMARRRALDRLRRRLAYRRATDRLETEMKAEVQTEERVCDFQPSNADLADLLKGVIRTLPPLQQEVVHLTFYEGWSQREIASRKSIALGTVKTRLQLAQKKMLNHLAPVYDKI
jgi:RNA polymerase sigma-70 factor, ECF subfamily